MRKLTIVTFATLVLVGAIFGSAVADERTCHYVNGVEGIKAGTVPPQGFYYRMYNVFYTSDDYTDEDGDSLDIDFDLFVYAMANRFLWVTDKRVLGADFFMDAVVPLVYTDVEIGRLGIDDSKFGLGDVNVEPFGLSWYRDRYEASFGLSVYIPIGEYDKDEPASPGRDMWTGMLTLGGTYYFDTEKTWSASILARYEVHSQKDETDVRLGDDFHFEWGVGKTLAKIWDVGLTGFCHWQLTDDSGSDVSWDKSVHDRVYAIGPEVSVIIPTAKLIVSLRNQWEFAAEDRSEGNLTTLTVTKIF